jgi:hypothetical protein
MRLFLLFSLLSAAAAWTTSSRVSGFAGKVLVTGKASESTCTLTMKKGKPNVPPQMRGQYKKQQEMMAMREQMIAASQPGADGLPVFNLFVRTKRANVSLYNHDDDDDDDDDDEWCI